MTLWTLSRAIGEIGNQYLEEAISFKPVKKRNAWLKWGAAAACLVLVACVVPVFTMFFGNTQHKAPVAIYYNTVAEMNDALNKATIYTDEKIRRNGDVPYDILISFEADPEGNADLAKPMQALIQQRSGQYSIRYYVVFGLDDVDDSYISGYLEQGLSFEINGITVHYSNDNNGKYNQGQGKFVFDGVLYVINVSSGEESVDVKPIVEQILTEE